MPHVEVQVRRPGTAAALPAGETGEILISGSSVPVGYWENPVETNAAFRAGWLHTGDLGHLDADGRLWITGRIKDVINVGGFKVNPVEVEKVLLEFPGVLDVGVVGIEGAGGLTSESVVAALVGGAGFVPDGALLQAHCTARLEKYKVPVRFVSVDEIPRSNTGKTKRTELARQVAGLLALPGPIY
jgi:acyl-CoA synthetase (AMP-forming)/AMP-acid ligase II